LICSNCKKQIPDDSAFCEYCGAKLTVEPETKKCEKCGAIVRVDALFCESCGAKFVAEEPEVVPIEPEVITAEEETSNDPKPVKKITFGSVILYLAIAAFVAGSLYFIVSRMDSNELNVKQGEPQKATEEAITSKEDIQYDEKQIGLLFNYVESLDGYELVGIDRKDAYPVETGVYNLNIPEYVRLKRVVSVADGALSSMDGITFDTVVIPSGLKNLPTSVFDNTGVRKFEVSQNNEYFSSVNGVLYNKDQTELLYYASKDSSNRFVIPSSVTTIKSGAFTWAGEIIMVYIPKTVKTVESSSFVFKDAKAYHIYYESNFEGVEKPDNFGYSEDTPVCVQWNVPQSKFDKFKDIEPNDNVSKEQYTITFAANGGSGFMEDITVGAGGSIMPPLCKFEREGYMFCGWSEYPGNNIISTVFYPTKDMKLVANWWKDPNYSENTYTIRFDPGEGSGTMSEIVVKKGESVLLPTCEYKKEGYNFYHWTEYPMNRYVAGNNAVYTPTKSITLKALWTPAKYYTVTLNSNDNRNATKSTRVDIGKEYVVSDSVFSGNGKNIIGWLDKEHNVKYDYNVGKCINEDVTLYAIWKEETLTDQSGSIGTNVTFSFSASTKVLTISGSGEMSDHEYNKAPWEDYKEYTEGIVVEEGVTKLGSNAFYGCSAAKYITLPDSLKVIEFNAFRACSSLKTITIPKNVERIWGSGQTFADDNLEEIIVAEGNKRYESVDGVLFDKIDHILKSYPAAKKGSTYSIPNTTVKVLGMAFSNSQYLESITIPKSVTFIDGNSLVHRCKKLVTVYYEGTSAEYEAIEKYIAPSGGTTLPDTVKLVCLGD